MRPALLVALALLLGACAKPADTTAPEAAPTGKVVQTDMTPDDMAKAMNIPLYPGSSAPDGLSSKPETRDDGSIHYSLVLATKDTPEAAGAWYAQKTGLTAMPGMGGKSIVGALPDGTNVIITIAPEAGRTLIRIKAIVYKK